jgi:pectate lyase
VRGNLAQGTVTIGSNKTIIGCSEGATLNGHVEMTGSKNVIIRNLNVVGYNCAPPDVSAGQACGIGEDTVSITKTSTNIWLDHVNISDSSDDLLDIAHASDFITVSYTKFFFSTQRTDPYGLGASGHRFASLIGSSTTNGTEDGGHLNVTFHNDWWASNTAERMPMVRFGKLHIFNSLFNAANNNYCIRVEEGANVLSEYNAFIGVKTPIDTTSFPGSTSFAKSANNSYTGTSGLPVSDLNPGGVFVPPYTYSPVAAASVEAAVKANTGPQ